MGTWCPIVIVLHAFPFHGGSSLQAADWIFVGGTGTQALCTCCTLKAPALGLDPPPTFGSCSLIVVMWSVSNPPLPDHTESHGDLL